MAFVTHTIINPLGSHARSRARPHLCRRGVRMTADTPETELKDASATTSSTTPVNGVGGTTFETPKMDTTAFTDFVDATQAKFEELAERAQNVDGAALVNDAKESSIGLIDNFLAGDWLNRGELYGAIQLAFVLLLLRQPGLLDGVVGFIVGPLTLAAGAALSGKALWDLGRRQISIWPAPVPGAELRTEGLYGKIRHPIYAGLLLASLGFAVSTASPERFAITLAMAAFLNKKIEVEEEFLDSEYPDWKNYVANVPYKLLPKIY